MVAVSCGGGRKSTAASSAAEELEVPQAGKSEHMEKGESERRVCKSVLIDQRHEDGKGSGGCTDSIGRRAQYGHTTERHAGKKEAQALLRAIK